MVVQATGRVVRDRRGLDLIVERRVPAPASEVWKWLTAPTHLKKWIGTYKGAPVVGGEISFTMSFEDGSAASRVTVSECTPESRFVLDWVADDDPWHVAISLADLGSSTVVFLAQRVSGPEQAGQVGPGWEYYLDRLLAARAGSAMPEWDDYFPSQVPYYERLATDGDPIAWTGR